MPISKPSLLISIVLVLIICALTIAQGGFFYEPVTISGAICVLFAIAYAAFYLHKQVSLFRDWKIWVVAIGFLFIAILCASSMGFHGIWTEPIGAVLCWIALTAFSFTCIFSTIPARKYVLNGFCWFVFSISVVSCLAFADLLPKDGGTFAAGRLCILFEYSNATGIWFGMGALIASRSNSTMIRNLNSFPIFAMLLTKSVGAVGTIAAVMVVATIFYVKADRREMLALSSAWIIALLSFSVSLISPPGGVVCLIVLSASIVVIAKVSPGNNDLSEKVVNVEPSKAEPSQVLVSKHLTALVIIGVAFVACCAISIALFLDPNRLIEAQGTFLERLAQIQDGLKLLATNIFLGIGPEQWADSYQAIQTVEYTAAINHCSYLQMALDGGIFVPIIYLSVMVYAIVNCWKVGERMWALAVIALLAHSIFDFDLHFYALQFLAVFLVSPNLSLKKEPGGSEI